MRAFISVEIRLSQRLEALLAELRRLGSAVIAVRADQMHITLVFLGEIAPDSISRVSEAMKRAVEGESAFDLETVGLGAFPNERRPSIIWAGVRDGGRLNGLYAKLHPLLAEAGFVLEDRPFHPHATLARIKARPPAALQNVMRAHRQESFGVTRVQELRLMASELGKHGPTHQVIEAFELVDR